MHHGLLSYLPASICSMLQPQGRRSQTVVVIYIFTMSSHHSKRYSPSSITDIDNTALLRRGSFRKRLSLFFLVIANT
jgi:hypothetical protein